MKLLDILNDVVEEKKGTGILNRMTSKLMMKNTRRLKNLMGRLLRLKVEELCTEGWKYKMR